MKNVKHNTHATYLKTILIKNNGKVQPVDASEIVYISSEGNYLEVGLKTENHLIRGSLRAVKKKLDPELFFRIHRSHIVNINYISYIEPLKNGRDFMVKLSTGRDLRMSRRYQEILDVFLIEK